MPSSSPETQQQPHNAPRLHGRSLLLAADIATLVAILLIHFLSPTKDTTIALVAVVTAGLFVFIPFLIDVLRPVRAGGSAAAADAAVLTNLQSVIRKDIRALYDGLVKHLAILEKAALENTAAVEQIHAAVREAATNANAAAVAAREAIAAANDAAAAAQEAAASAKEAAEAAPTEGANDEITERLASLSVLGGEDGEVRRLVVAFESFQQEQRDALHIAADLFRRLEEAVRQSVIAKAPEQDGPLPPSLAGKAFNAAPSSAVSRLIGNAVRKAPAPPAAEPRASSPTEDDVWNVAADMANAESEPAAPPPSAGHPQHQPNDEDDLPPRWPDLVAAAPAPAPAPSPAPETKSDNTPGNEANETLEIPLISESARRIISSSVLAPTAQWNDAPRPAPQPEPEDAPAPPPPPASVPAQTDLLGALGFQTPPPAPAAPRHNSARPGTLIANVFTGLGGKPFVRGIGPGLSEDIGSPMEPVAIGRWQWVSPDPDQPAVVTIWKNDIHRALGDPIKIPSGESVETSPEFPL